MATSTFRTRAFFGGIFSLALVVGSISIAGASQPRDTNPPPASPHTVRPYLSASPRTFPPAQVTFTVNTTSDGHDNTPGDGFCFDGTGHCSLRAAVEEASASGLTTNVNVPAGTYNLTLGELNPTDAGGLLGGGRTGGGALLYPCPDGMYASFKRISIAAPGATPGTPIAGGAWMTLNTDSGGDLQQEAIIPQTGQTQALPCLITDGSAAIVLRRGSKLVVVGAALPVSTTISFRFQIELYHTAKAAEAATAQGG